MTLRFRAWLIRHLGIAQCGAFGGCTYPASALAPLAGSEVAQRWCRKRFGHIDSCAYDTLPNMPSSQPDWRFRARLRGWDPSP